MQIFKPLSQSLNEQDKPHVNSTGDFGIYVCPTCKGQLKPKDEALVCPVCQVTYPTVDGIPDFILEDLSRSTHPVLREVHKIDWLARIYETKLWYPLVVNLYGGLGSTSLEELLRTVAAMVEMEEGLILDVACGPGTLGRRIASLSKTVYGVDVSMGMLRQGITYVKRDHISNVHFARARAEALPFQDALFDAALCGSALHLFGDPVLVLREIDRTMKKGAPLAVTTFVGGDKGLLRFRRVRERLQQKRGVRVFKLPELEQYLAETGFEDFRPQVYGSILVFSARKRRA